MRITDGYTALGNICGRQPARGSQRTAPHCGRAFGDTVSISDEAMSAYRNSLSADVDAPGEETQATAAKFRQALEEAWNAGAGGEDVSLMAKLRSALSSWK